MRVLTRLHRCTIGHLGGDAEHQTRAKDLLFALCLFATHLIHDDSIFGFLFQMPSVREDTSLDRGERLFFEGGLLAEGH